MKRGLMNVLFGLICSIDVIAIFLLFRRVMEIDNDKAPLLIMFFYPALIIFNLICALVLRLFRVDHYKMVLKVVLVLLVLFLPLAFIAFRI